MKTTLAVLLIGISTLIPGTARALMPFCTTVTNIIDYDVYFKRKLQPWEPAETPNPPVKIGHVHYVTTNTVCLPSGGSGTMAALVARIMTSPGLTGWKETYTLTNYPDYYATTNILYSNSVPILTNISPTVNGHADFNSSITITPPMGGSFLRLSP